jgi:hypothetical protein
MPKNEEHAEEFGSWLKLLPIVTAASACPCASPASDSAPVSHNSKIRFKVLLDPLSHPPSRVCRTALRLSARCLGSQGSAR